MKFTRQYDKMDCGPACVRMVVSAHRKVYPLAWIRTRASLTREGVSVAGIRRALKAAGMESGAFRMTPDELAEQCPLPAILHWNQNHFVVLEDVVEKRGTRRWKIADPAFGRHTIDEDELKRHWLSGERGVVVAAEPGEDFGTTEAPTERHSFMDFARKHVWPYRLTLVKSGIVMLIGLGLGLVLPFLTQAMVDKGINGKNPGLIFAILGAQVALTAGTFVMQMIGSRVALYMSTHISVSIITGYLEKLLRLPMTFFDTKSPGDYQQRISDHGRLQSFLTTDSLQTLFSLVSVPFYLAIVGSYSLVILGAYVVFTACAIGWSVWLMERRRAIDFEQFQLNARMQNRMIEMTNGIVDIKVNGYENYKIGQWRGLQQEQYELGRRSLSLNQKQNIGFSAISQMRNLVILCWIALQVVEGEMTLGMMMSVSVIIGMISGPLGQLVGFMQRLQEARISLERSDEVNMSADEDGEGMAEVPCDRPLEIRVEGVTFGYGDIGKAAVEDVSFTIPAGGFVAIVGESGSGKTTLLKLLLKFYKPRQGRILLGGRDMAEYSAGSLRRVSGVVMQENYVFSDTIERNISAGETSDPERLGEAIKTACLEEFISSRPLGIHTMAGSEGNGLSGGERQRIMMARVAYKRPPYIMLDEATSNLDAETERRISENIAEKFDGATKIVIAHRLSTVKGADLIVVMKKGRVVETGTHEELIARKGYYLTLISNQLELADG